MSNSHKFLFKLGGLVLLTPVALAIVLVVLHRLGLVKAWVFPLVPISIFCVFGGASCITMAQMRRERRSSLRSHFRNPLGKTNLLPQTQVTNQQQPHHRRLMWLRSLCWGLAILLISINLSTYLLAYHATHVRAPGQFGLGVPKPSNIITPSDRGLPYTTLKIPVSQSEWLEAWEIPSQTLDSKGTVLLFHGNLGTKSSQLLAPAQSFVSLGFDAILVDFQGVGGSTGTTNTIGVREAQDVVATFNFLKKRDIRESKPHSPIVLYGVSMGSAAILKAIATHHLNPNAVILELPFAHLVDAVKSRLRYYRVPTFPTAELLIFWAGIQHGLNGFHHNPIDYAKEIACPTLVIHGAQDKWTTVADIEALVNNIPAPKQLVISPKAGHHQLIGVDRPLWDMTVKAFLRSL